MDRSYTPGSFFFNALSRSSDIAKNLLGEDFSAIRTYTLTKILRDYSLRQVIAKSGIASLQLVSVAMTNSACVSPVSNKRQKLGRTRLRLYYCWWL